MYSIFGAFQISVLFMLCHSPLFGLPINPKIQQPVNLEKVASADVVIRAVVSDKGQGSKYMWTDVLVLQTYKSPAHVKLSPKLKIAYLSFGQELPPGEATLYLRYYNREKPNLGWKLVEILNKKDYKYGKGYSHHSQVDVSEVLVKVDGGKIAGTLARAVGDKAKKKRAVLFVSGSGPTDRDGNTIGAFGKHNCLKYLSDEIVQFGVTTLRIDKRGIGGSNGILISEADIRFSTYVDDITNCIEYLNQLGYSEVTLLGHSEGALIATVAAKHPSVVSLISVAGIGRPADEVFKSQLKNNLPKELFQKAEKILNELAQGNKVAEVPDNLTWLFRPSVQPYLISLCKIDPVKEIAKLEIPMIILHGTTDIQVPVENASFLNKASKDSKLVIVEGMQHVLKAAKGNLKQQQSSYTNPKLPLHPQLVIEVLNFLKK